MGKRGEERRRRERAAAKASGGAAAPARRDIFRRIRQSVVGIVNAAPADIDAALKQSSSAGKNLLSPLQVVGSGFLYENGLVITAAHVIEPWVEAANRAPKGTIPPLIPVIIPGLAGGAGTEARWTFALGPVRGFRTDNERDLAVLELMPQPQGSSFLLRPAGLATATPEEGDEIAVCGYPLGNRLHGDLMSGGLLVPSFSGGIVSAVLPFSGAPPATVEMIQISAMVNPGNSGGPAFDVRTGKVFGVVVSINTVNLTPRVVPGQPSPNVRPALDLVPHCLRPVLRIQRIPVNTSRGSRQGRPRPSGRRRGLGTNGSSTAH